MIYVTIDEYFELIRIAVYQSDFVDEGDSKLWHPDDIETVVASILKTVTVVLQHAPVDRR